MRVGFVASDWGRHDDGTWTPGGTTWVRCILPARALDQAGHTTVVGQHVASHNVTRELIVVEEAPGGPVFHHGLDVVLITRWMHQDAAGAILAGRAAGQIVVNDLDDLYHGMGPSNKAWRDTHPDVNPTSNRDHYLAALQASSAVTCSTPYIADQYRRPLAGVPTRTIRNAIDPSRYRPRPVDPDGTTFGWAGHVAYRHHDLEQLRGIAGPWARRNGWTFHHLGYTDLLPHAAELAGVDGPTTAQPLVSMQSYPTALTDLDVGLVPLSGHPFNRAKSCIKGMEYAAAGVPFVASDTDEYRWLADHGVGRVARKPREWLRHLDQLADPDVRQADRDRNLAGLEALTIDVAGVAWHQWLVDLADALT